MHDLIILGGGPAGMTAAVYSARKKLNILLISQDLGGQVLWTLSVENYMGFTFIEGPDLMRRFEEHIAQFPIDMRIGEKAVFVGQLDNGFEVRTESGESYQGRAVILATGKRPRQLELPGEARLQGRGVSYCAVCDGPVFAGEVVAVAGSGNSALEAARDVASFAEHVILVARDPLVADEMLVDSVKRHSKITMLLGHEIRAIKGFDRVTGITMRDLVTGEDVGLEVAGIFVEIGLIPNSEIVRGLVHMNDAGEILVNGYCETNMPGLFAAGDVTNVPHKQIVVATGEGAKASLQAHMYLLRTELLAGALR